MRIMSLKYLIQVLFTLTIRSLNILLFFSTTPPLNSAGPQGSPAPPPSYLPEPEPRAPELGPTDCTPCPPLCSPTRQCPQ